MIHSFLRAAFIASIVVSVVGGVLLVACQAAGLVLGERALITGPGGVFKTVLCVAASASAVAAYLFAQRSTPDPAGEEAAR